MVLEKNPAMVGLHDPCCRPLVVSVVIIFLNAARWLDEAVRSVVAQDYPHWELILVDDGSVDGSSAIAREWAVRNSRMHYLEHADHANRGMPASRNTGVRMAKGDLIAFLDADDVWQSDKLSHQVALFDADPAIGFVYGAPLYWYSWSGECAGRDALQDLGFAEGTCLDSPQLAAYFLENGDATPCPSEMMMRRSVWAEVGGSVEHCDSVYEDQALSVKLALVTRIAISASGRSRYRRHEATTCAQAARTGQNVEARRVFLMWLEQYLRERAVVDANLWRALRSEQVRLEAVTGFRALGRSVARRVLSTGARAWLRECDVAFRVWWRARHG